MSIYNIDNFRVPKDIKPGNQLRFNFNVNDSKISIGAIGMSRANDFFKLSLINLIKNVVGNENIDIEGENIEFLINDKCPREPCVYAKLVFPMRFGFVRLTRDINNLAYISILEGYKHISSFDLYQVMNRFVRKLQTAFEKEVKLLETLKEKNIDYEESIESGEYALEYNRQKLDIEENIEVYRLRSFMNRNIDIRRQLEETTIVYIEEPPTPEERVEKFFGKSKEPEAKLKFKHKKPATILPIRPNGEILSFYHFSKPSSKSHSN